MVKEDEVFEVKFSIRQIRDDILEDTWLDFEPDDTKRDIIFASIIGDVVKRHCFGDVTVSVFKVRARPFPSSLCAGKDQVNMAVHLLQAFDRLPEDTL